MDDGPFDDRLVDTAAANARDLGAELAWLDGVIARRFASYFGVEGPSGPAVAPDLSASRSGYAGLLRSLPSEPAVRLALILALAPNVRPKVFDILQTRNEVTDRRFVEFGGVLRDTVFWPTAETLAFVLGGAELDARFRAMALFEPGGPFATVGCVTTIPEAPDDPPVRHRLHVPPEVLARVTTGAHVAAAPATDVPAQRIVTGQSWSDLILTETTRAQIGEIEAWCRHGRTLMRDWGMAATLRPGHRCLFHGPPGTGKTMTAGLLGTTTGQEVYRIDLSLVVSKYIGETEKRLAHLFDMAERHGWILFFDEADALFGKRSATRDAHDRYANQEVAYLLQRIETFDGVAILASNLRENMDEAFARRFETVVYFPLPGPEERRRIWQAALPSALPLDEGIDWGALARDHALSGGAITNAVRYVALRHLADGRAAIGQVDLVHAARRELAKEGKLA